jgi:hypothetical protein
MVALPLSGSRMRSSWARLVFISSAMRFLDFCARFVTSRILYEIALDGSYASQAIVKAMQLMEILGKGCEASVTQGKTRQSSYK